VAGDPSGAGLHPEGALLCVLDRAMSLDIVEPDKVQSFEAGAGVMAIVPASIWHHVYTGRPNDRLFRGEPGKIPVIARSEATKQ
jgi:hypothetical protein